MAKISRDGVRRPKFSRYLLAPLLGALMGSAAYAQTMTDVGTPRAETLIVQTFDGKASNPDAQNPLNQYAIWRGFRELGWSFLWEMDTATGQSYPELAAGPVEVLNPEHTQFRVKLREGVYWSDGVEFTTDDIIYTLETRLQVPRQADLRRPHGELREGGQLEGDRQAHLRVRDAGARL